MSKEGLSEPKTDKHASSNSSVHDDQASISASHKPGDWILDLFSPSYAHAADVFEGKHEVKEEGRKIKVVSAFDPESIKNVYERVHMMLKMDEEVKNRSGKGNLNGNMQT